MPLKTTNSSNSTTQELFYIVIKLALTISDPIPFTTMTPTTSLLNPKPLRPIRSVFFNRTQTAQSNNRTRRFELPLRQPIKTLDDEELFVHGKTADNELMSKKMKQFLIANPHLIFPVPVTNPEQAALFSLLKRRREDQLNGSIETRNGLLLLERKFSIKSYQPSMMKNFS